MKKVIANSVTLITIMAMVFTLATPMRADAATKVKLNKTKVTLNMAKEKTKTVQLKVKGTSKKAKWKTSDKKIATVSKTGKVTAKKKGTAVITAKAGKRVLKCEITVKNTNKAKTKSSHKHKYTLALVEKPTCGKSGRKVYACRCGACYKKDLPATGRHNWVTKTDFVSQERVWVVGDDKTWYVYCWNGHKVPIDEFDKHGWETQDSNCCGYGGDPFQDGHAETIVRNKIYKKCSKCGAIKDSTEQELRVVDTD